MPQKSSEIFSSRILIILNVLLIIQFNIVCSTSANAATNVLNECKWDYNKITKHTKCHLRTLDASHSAELLLDAQGTGKLDILCDESILLESQLPKKLFRDLSSVTELEINSCKIFKLSEHSFDGLSGLRTLTVNTKNSEWDEFKTLEVQLGTMNGLKQLTTLNLTESNIRVIPDGFYCPLSNLQVLNLSRNRIRSTENLGFSDECSALKEINTLDLSWNELRVIPKNWSVTKLRRLQNLFLQYNNISELNSDILNGLSALRILNLSANKIAQIPSNFFSGSKELSEIYLQNNELFELPNRVFHQLGQLLVLDLSENQLTSHNINNETFAGLIRLVVLNLSHNALTRIDSKIFKELYFLQELNLRNNSIGYIDDNAFSPLYNLHELNLAENRLLTLTNKLFNGLQVLSKLKLSNNLISSLEPNVFKNCSDLKELDLSSNQLQDVPEALKYLSVLRTLDLGENQIGQFRDGAFKNLIQLTGLRLIDNRIENITKGMFADLTHLSVLSIGKNRIQFIENGSFNANSEIEAIRLDGNFLSDIDGIFSGLPSLLWLNLAENHLSWFDYAFVPINLKYLDVSANYIDSLRNHYKLQEQIKVTTLIASHNLLTEIGPMNVPNSIEFFYVNNNNISRIHANTFIDKVKLTRVDMYNNALQKIQMQQFRISPSMSAETTGESKHTDTPLPVFYMSGNPIQCDCSMEWLQRINNFTSRQYPKIVDLNNIECVMPHSRSVYVRPIETVDITEFVCPYKRHCFSLCNCCDQNGCECDMTCPKNCSCYHDTTWATNVIDCGHQQSQLLPAHMSADASEIYLDGNNYPELDVAQFRKHSKLRHLYLNASRIEIIRNRTFFGLSTLQTLHLHDNKLQMLHGFEFEQLIKLKELNLHNNRLTYIGNQTFIQLKSLQILRIDGNQLVNAWLWQLLPPMVISSQQLERISMGRNPWSCRCRFLQEMTQFVAENAVIIQDAQDIYCLDEENGNVQRQLDFNSSSVCSDFYSSSSNPVANFILFNDYIPLLITLLATICLLILFIILFVFREPLKLWAFSHYGFFGPPFEDSEKLYDACFFHSAKDTEYVIKYIANEFESGRQQNLRLCLQYRDLNEDASYNQLLEVACASRKIVIILTRNFLQTEWARFDLRRSIHDAMRGRLYKLILIEDPDVITDAENDIELLPYLKTSAVKRIKRNDRNFLDKMRYALPMESGYRGNNYTLDHHHPMTMPHYPPQHLMTQQRQQMKPYPNNCATMNGGLMGYHQNHRHAPPAYCPDQLDETNYSSATTATPSPHPSRHNILASDIHHPASAQPQQNQLSKQNNNNLQQQQQQQQRPLSEHIYSSIDSDYSTLDCENQLLQPQEQTPQHHHQLSHDSGSGIQRPTTTWRTNANGGNIPKGHHVQAYLV